MNQYTIKSNEYLSRDVIAYYNTDYLTYNNPRNPSFLNDLKNTYNTSSVSTLKTARDKTAKIIQNDIQKIVDKHCLNNCIVVAIPRSKKDSSYFTTQMCLRDAISIAANKIDACTDGTLCVIRHTNTNTTHLSHNGESKFQGRITSTGFELTNIGDKPYVGITKKTCTINCDLIRGNVVILVDDIYTPDINIDEDCIEALYNEGAKQVIFYSVAKTKKNK